MRYIRPTRADAVFNGVVGFLTRMGLPLAGSRVLAVRGRTSGEWRTTPVTVDWNKDGLIDLVMLDQEGYLAFFERAMRGGRRVLLHPKRIFSNEKGDPLQFNKGMAGEAQSNPLHMCTRPLAQILLEL